MNTNVDMAPPTLTLKQVKNGAQLPKSVYKTKPYIVLSKEDVVLAAGNLEYIKSLSNYFDNMPVEARQHDLHANDNTKIVEMTDKATARPWRMGGEFNYTVLGKDEYIGSDRLEQRICACDATGLYRAGANIVELAQEAKANANLIVRAVNAHDAMKQALESALATDGDFVGWEKKARAALKLAKGE